MKTTAVTETNLAGLKLIKRGKVRDLYDLGDKLLIVATDRISTFDVVMPTPIPEKGAVLTSLSRFWFEKTEKICANHLCGKTVEEVVKDPESRRILKDRAMVVQKTEPLPVEVHSSLNLGLDLRIPTDYIEDEHQRLRAYKPREDADHHQCHLELETLRAGKTR